MKFGKPNFKLLRQYSWFKTLKPDICRDTDPIFVEKKALILKF